MPMIDDLNHQNEDPIFLVNEALKADSTVENCSDCHSDIEWRLSEANRQIESQEGATLQREQDRLKRREQSSLQRKYVLKRLQQFHDIIEKTNGRVDEIISRTVTLHQQQQELTEKITILERFKAFIVNIDQLEKYLVNREFSCMASLLLAALQFSETFETATADNHHDYVNEQLQRLTYLKKMMHRQVMDMFEEKLKHKSHPLSGKDTIQLAHATTVMDVLGESSQETLTRWYCNRQLSDYKDVFRGNRELCTLESLPKRYAWLKRLLIAYDAEHATMFPESWRVDFYLCLDFCIETSKDMISILDREMKDEKNLENLQVAVQQTRQFEQFLQRKFKTNRNSGLSLSIAFEPYLNYFVEAHDQDITAYIDSLPSTPTVADFEHSNILGSAPEVFLLFREVLQDIAELSTRKPLGDLCSVFARQLISYARYLEKALPAVPKKGLTLNEIKLICIIINTLDYCSVTTEQMEKRLQGLIDPKCRDEVQFDNVKQDILVRLSISLARLFQAVKVSYDSIWSNFNDKNLRSIVTVTNHSDYIETLTRNLCNVPRIRSLLIETRHFSSLCNRLVVDIFAKFTAAVHSLKPLTEIMAQQLLFDLESLKSLLIDWLRSNRFVSMRLPYQKLIAAESSYMERLLKCLLLPSEPIDFFVKNYVVAAADGDEGKFIQTLDLRGLKKSQQPPYLVEFKKLIPEKPSAIKIEKSSELANINAQIQKILKNFR